MHDCQESAGAGHAEAFLAVLARLVQVHFAYRESVARVVMLPLVSWSQESSQRLL